MTKHSAQIGIIGGSGLYQMENLKNRREVSVSTPFGKPSGKFVLGKLNGCSVVFLPRHGVGHTLLPSEINYRANIYAFKRFGVTRLISVSAVGSMKKEIAPGHIVVPHQFYDLTRTRKSSFFGGGIVAHVSLADPICPQLAKWVAEASRSVGATVHEGGTYICMEGPQFSTRAESQVHRMWDISVIGMTNATEAKLAREAEICYVTLALSTDYDCWHISEEPVTANQVVQVLLANVALSQKILQTVVTQIDPQKSCSCWEALKNAIVTDPRCISPKVKKNLNLLMGRYFKKS